VSAELDEGLTSLGVEATQSTVELVKALRATADKTGRRARTDFRGVTTAQRVSGDRST
jgi:hypothetical protein